MTSPGFLIRRLTPDDWEEYREIRLAALADAPDAFGSTLAGSLRYTEQDWRSRLSTGTTFAAERSDTQRLIGTATGLRLESEGIARLVGMWVAPEVRRQGVGEALVEQVITWAREAGFPRLILDVTAGNGAAERLYERCGFVQTGERISIDGEREHRMVVMVREL